MIKRELFYFIECDNCNKKLSEDNSEILHEEKKEIIEEAEDRGWIKKGKKFFCCECQVP